MQLAFLISWVGNRLPGCTALKEIPSPVYCLCKCCVNRRQHNLDEPYAANALYVVRDGCCRICRSKREDFGAGYLKLIY